VDDNGARLRSGASELLMTVHVKARARDPSVRRLGSSPLILRD